MTLAEFFRGVGSHPAYWIALGFFAIYPVVSSIMWVSTALNFYLRRERDKGGNPGPEDETPPRLESYPMVSVLIPAYCEEKVIAETLECAIHIDYPNYEVVVVDDASTDETREAVRPFVEKGRVRLIAKSMNEGKAMAMNDARSEERRVGKECRSR